MDVWPRCFPYVLSIRFNAGGDHICTGFLFAEGLALTAAHCFMGDFSENPVVIFGGDQ
eukprot:evm.model.scf_2597.1 EVM.evm.TU.scf_2597.1   scf_2597:5695-5865(+)